ncbi:MAG: 5,10-methylenetetrahydromethanopterin reductase [Methanobacteriaceae archaeon]
MEFGIGFVPNGSIDKIVKLVELAEDVGFDYAWIADQYINKDVYQTLVKIAEATETIKIGPGVTNPYVRNPAITASSIATLDEISNGRAVLGIGSGDKATFDALGSEWVKPVSTIKTAITDINTLINGGTTEAGAKLQGVSPVQNYGIPTYMAVQEPMMLKTAGEIADGVFINASHPKEFETVLPIITSGASSAGRLISDIDVVAYTRCSIDNNYDKAVSAVKSVVASSVAGSSSSLFARHGLPEDTGDKFTEFLTKSDFDRAICDVNNELIDIFSICGTVSDFIPKIEALKDIGVTQYVAGSPIGSDKEKSIKLLGEVLSSFK